MAIAAALALIVQIAAPGAAPGAVPVSGPVSGPAATETAAPSPRTIAIPATARARILRPAIITLDPRTAQPELGNASIHNVQRQRDEAGTVWIEFS